MNRQYTRERKEATKITKEYLQREKDDWDTEMLAIENEDVEDAKAHLIFEVKDESVYDEDGNVIYDIEKYPIPPKGEEPDTVNPYLWKITKELPV